MENKRSEPVRTGQSQSLEILYVPNIFPTFPNTLKKLAVVPPVSH